MFDAIAGLDGRIFDLRRWFLYYFVFCFVFCLPSRMLIDTQYVHVQSIWSTACACNDGLNGHIESMDSKWKYESLALPVTMNCPPNWIQCTASTDWRISSRISCRAPRKGCRENARTTHTRVIKQCRTNGRLRPVRTGELTFIRWANHHRQSCCYARAFFVLLEIRIWEAVRWVRLLNLEVDPAKIITVMRYSLIFFSLFCYYGCCCHCWYAKLS